MVDEDAEWLLDIYGIEIGIIFSEPQLSYLKMVCQGFIRAK